MSRCAVVESSRTGKRAAVLKPEPNLQVESMEALIQEGFVLGADTLETD